MKSTIAVAFLSLIAFWAISDKIDGDKKIRDDTLIFHADSVMYFLCEKSYFEGQREALSGDIRIESVNGKWHWAKSPWNSDTNSGIAWRAKLRYNP